MPPLPSRAHGSQSRDDDRRAIHVHHARGRANTVITAQERYPAAGWYLRNAREAFHLTDAGGRFSMGPHGEYGEYGPEGDQYIRSWRLEFLTALDRRINAKGRPADRDGLLEEARPGLAAARQSRCRPDQPRRHPAAPGSRNRDHD